MSVSGSYIHQAPRRPQASPPRPFSFPQDAPATHSPSSYRCKLAKCQVSHRNVQMSPISQGACTSTLTSHGGSQSRPQSAPHRESPTHNAMTSAGPARSSSSWHVLPSSQTHTSLSQSPVETTQYDAHSASQATPPAIFQSRIRGRNDSSATAIARQTSSCSQTRAYTSACARPPEAQSTSSRRRTASTAHQNMRIQNRSRRTHLPLRPDNHGRQWSLCAQMQRSKSANWPRRNSNSPLLDTHTAQHSAHGSRQYGHRSSTDRPLQNLRPGQPERTVQCFRRQQRVIETTIPRTCLDAHGSTYTAIHRRKTHKAAR